MDSFTRGELQQLLDRERPPCVSVFLPTRRGGSEQDAIRWKNLLRQAEDRLTANGLRNREARDLLEPARQLRDNDPFWHSQGDGLAAFVAPGFLQTFRLPVALPELVVTAKRFHLKPLLPLLAAERFYLLSLSQKHVRVYQGTATGLREVPVERIPHSLAEALRFHEGEGPLQFHSVPAPGGRGRWSAIFHGHGVGIDDHKDDLLAYFQRIDRGLHDLLRDERAPLVLASVEYLWPIYRAANRYPHLLDAGVAGHPDQLSPADLHHKAHAVVAPRFAEARQRAAAGYDQLAGTGRTTADVAEVVRAAHGGWLEALFVAADREVWGTFDAASGQVAVHATQEPDDEDLLDFAAVQTLRHGGGVHVVPAADVPGGGVAAGIFRKGAGVAP